jgi:hypothetical protein
MKNWLIQVFTVKPVILDGFLYVLIALFGGMEATFTSDEAFKYLNVYFIYYSKTIVVWLLEVVTAIKMFRSTSYSDHLAKVKTDQAIIDGDSKQTVITTESKTNEIKVNPPITPIESKA